MADDTYRAVDEAEGRLGTDAGRAAAPLWPPLRRRGSVAMRPTRFSIYVTPWLRSYGLTALALTGIMIFALCLRLTNVNWDYGQHLHPDERFLAIISSQIKEPKSIGEYFNTEKSPLNPYKYGDTFVYGTFPVFLNKAVAGWLDRGPDGSTHASADLFRAVIKPFGLTMQRPDGSFTFNDGYDSNGVGRVLSALADVLTIALIFELGRVLYDRRVGLVASVLLSVAVLHIQYSHFFGAETWLALFVTATLYFSVRIAKYESRWNYLWAGVAYGFVLATKLSGLPAIGLPALATLIRLWPSITAGYQRFIAPEGSEAVATESTTARSSPAISLQPILSAALGIVVLALAAGLVFRTMNPYAFEGPGFFDVIDVNLDLKQDVLSLHGLTHLAPLDPTKYLAFNPKYRKDIDNLRNQQSGADFPPNVQWINRTPIVFPLSNIVLWGMGVPLALAVAGGVLYATWRLLMRKDLTSLLPLVWSGVFFFFIARNFNPTMRYFIPIYPSLILLAAFGLVALWDNAPSLRLPAFEGARLSGAWSRVSARLQPRLPLIARGAVGLALVGALLWALAFLGVYTHPISRVQASYWIADNLTPGTKLTYNEWDDAIPLSLPGINTQAYTIVPLKPYGADSTNGIAELIDGLDKTNYVVETSNRVYASLKRFPARYPSVVLYYDHLFDGSLGFKKIAEFTNYPTLFGIDIPDQSSEEAFTVYDHPKVTIWQKTATYSHDLAVELLQPDKTAAAIRQPPSKAATNGLTFRPEDLKTQQQGGTWSSIFSDSGIVKHYPTLLWLLLLEGTALAATPFAFVLLRRLPDRGYLLAKALGVVLLAYPVWLLVSLKLFPFERLTILLWLDLLLAGAACLAYRSRVEMRAWLRANWRLVLVSEALFLVAFFFFRELRLDNPDLWHPFRGGEKPMDVAYLTAVTRSTTLPPYNPWFANGYINYYYLGQFFTATLSKATAIPPEVAFNLAVPTYFALTVAGAFSVAYNLTGAARRLIRRAPGLGPIPLWSVYAAGFAGAAFVALIGNLDGIGIMAKNLSAVSAWHVDLPLPVVDSVINSIGGLWQVVFHGAQLREFDFWRPSRMMPPTISITEFPYFSFLFADLHAHMMAIAFQVLAVGVSLSLVLNRRGEGTSRGDWVTIALLGLIVGSLRWLNSWDYPPFLMLGLAAVLIGERRLEGGPKTALPRVVLKCLLLGGASALLYQPFMATYQSPVSGLHPSPDTTPVHQYLAHFGLFLAVLGVWLIAMVWRALKPSPLLRVLRTPWQEQTPDTRASLVLLALAGFFVLAADAIVLSRGYALIAALLPVLALFVALGLHELKTARADGGLRLFVYALVGLALGLSIGVDLVTINGDIERMNTVFKFYLHAWVLLGLASSFALWHLVFVLWRPTRIALPSFPHLPVALAKGALAALILGALIYPVMATPVRLRDRFVELPKTLDGMAYMQVATYDDPKGVKYPLIDDYNGIQWLRDNVKGSPPIVEGRTDLYRWGGRISIYTGLPDVIGWDWHQRQQRGDLAYLVDQRTKEVDDFYKTTDVLLAQHFLREYGVQYVILGEIERLYYPGDGLSKFTSGLGGSLEEVYRGGSMTIYRVKDNVLSANAAP